MNKYYKQKNETAHFWCPIFNVKNSIIIDFFLELIYFILIKNVNFNKD